MFVELDIGKYRYCISLQGLAKFDDFFKKRAFCESFFYESSKDFLNRSENIKNRVSSLNESTPSTVCTKIP